MTQSRGQRWLDLVRWLDSAHLEPHAVEGWVWNTLLDTAQPTALNLARAARELQKQYQGPGHGI